MSHIVIDARSINSSTGTYMERLLHYLQQIDQSNRYTVLIRTVDKDFWQPTAANFTVCFADFDDYSFEEQLGFNRFLKSLNADLVHFTMPQQPIRYHGRKVTTVHDLTLLRVYNSDKNYLIFKAKQLVGKYVFWRVARDNDAIITPTEFTKNDLVKFAHISPDKVYVTYESADIGQFTPEPYEIPFERFIINVGKHSDYKNIPVLAEAHQKILEKHPDVGLILVNPKDDAVKSNEALFTKRGYKNILFTDRISKNQRDYLYERATVYVTPSYHEGFGLGALEAMGFGIATLSSNASCLPEVYADGVDYFDPASSGDLAAKLDKVISHEDYRALLAARGKKRHASFSWQKMVRETFDVYQSVLNSKR